jgi:HEAT repeat protein
MTEDQPPDLGRWTPAGQRTTDYAVTLLLSTHLQEIRAAEAWLLGHPDEATPALIAALATPAAQAAAVLLGAIGDPGSIEPLLAAYRRGGPGLRSAVERGLALHRSPAAAAALDALRAESLAAESAVVTCICADRTASVMVTRR